MLMSVFDKLENIARKKENADCHRIIMMTRMFMKISVKMHPFSYRDKICSLVHVIHSHTMTPFETSGK